MFNRNSEDKKQSFEIKKLKIQNGYKTINWTQLIIVVIVSVVLTAGTFAILATWFSNTLMLAIATGMEGISKPFAQVVEANPEIIFALNDDLPKEALYLTLVKQMSAEANINFNGYFTTITERSLEKVDLTCIDKYSYIHLGKQKNNPTGYISPTTIEQLNDNGCSKINVNERDYPSFYKPNNTNPEENLIYYKCPLRNCEQREVQRIVMDEFIPQRIGITKVSVEGK